MELTGYQVKKLYEFMGGDFDTNVTVERMPERTMEPGTGDEPTTLRAGLYVWCTDYPEEGAVLLLEDESHEDEVPDDEPGEYPSGEAFRSRW